MFALPFARKILGENEQMYHFLFYSIHANLVFQVSLNQGVAVSLNQSSQVQHVEPKVVIGTVLRSTKYMLCNLKDLLY